MFMIDEVFILLEDGRWHYSKEILEKSGLDAFKLFKILNFLAEYNFIELEEGSERVRLTSEVVQFLKGMRSLEADLSVNMR